MPASREQAAVQCLEQAVHHRTVDQDILTAIHGYRRLAGSATLSDVCKKYFGARNERSIVEYRRDWKDKIANLNAENSDLEYQNRRGIAERDAAIQDRDRYKEQIDQLESEKYSLEQQLARQFAVVEELQARVRETPMQETVFSNTNDEIGQNALDEPSQRAPDGVMLEEMISDDDVIHETIIAEEEPPASEMPLAEEPLAEEPLAEEPAAEEPAAEEPVKEKKKYKQGTTTRIRWTDEEEEFLVSAHLTNLLLKNKELARSCSDKFGRNITENAIRGALTRLRTDGRVPRYRPGHERESEPNRAAAA